MVTTLKKLTGTFVEWLTWGAICTGLSLGLVLRTGHDVHHAISWFWRRPSQGHLTHPRISTFFLTAALAGVVLAAAPPVAAQGRWGGSPVNPGFDENTVVEVTGTATQVDLAPRGRPATLRLEATREAYAVMLGPGWYLVDCLIDIRNGDPITVEGSKIMDPRGNLHLVAARVTNRRTGSVLALRDDAGRPLWMGGRPWRKGK